MLAAAIAAAIAVLIAPDATLAAIAAVIAWSIVSVTVISTIGLLIKTKSDGHIMILKEGSNLAIDMQKILLMLRDKENENKETIREYDLTHFFNPFELKHLRSWYSFNYKQRESKISNEKML